jgi:hypothetical protein
MVSCFRPLTHVVVAFVVLVGMAAHRSTAETLSDQNYFELEKLPPHWASFFRGNARIHLGTEQRLPNGVSWRLLTDLGTGLAMPRVTWMPNKRRLSVANRLLDIEQGSGMFMEIDQWRVVELENDVRRQLGAPPLAIRHSLEQRDVSLTYVGARFMSIMEAMLVHPSGSHGQTLLSGKTFDLESGHMAEVTACPGSQKPYGTAADANPDTFLFQYGNWLQLCDRASYRKFIAAVKEVADRSARHLPSRKELDIARCEISSEWPLIDEERRFILYLTHDGLAVHVSARQCPLERTVDNPIIVPYRQLEPLMRPGALRDELLK